MQSDARAAANAIVANRKAQSEGCGPRLRNAFACAPGARLVFILVAITELVTNTFLMLFDVIPNRTTIYMILVLVGIPRILIFIWASWRLSPKYWWRYWITVDNVLLLTTVIAIVYGYMLLRPPATAVGKEGELGWRIAAVVSLPFLMGAFNGNFRILVKMFPWTPVTIFIYKLLRIYAVVIGTVTQLELRFKTVSGMDSGLLLLYITSQVSYHVSLLSRIPSWTAWQRTMEAKAKAAINAGVTLTLDEKAMAASQVPAAYTVAAATGYQSFDEENEETIGFFQNGGNDPALQMLRGTNDDAAVPVNLSAMNALRAEAVPYLTEGDSGTDSSI